MILEDKTTGTRSLSQVGALSKSVAHFARPSGPNLLSRTEPFMKWLNTRIEADVWPYSRSFSGAPGTTSVVRKETGRPVDGINFASTDYLGLANHPGLIEKAVQALREIGPHTPSSPMLQGNTDMSHRLEEAIADLVGMEHVMLFSTGWGAGFGSISGLVRATDHIVMDNIAHACLQQGALAATQNIRRHEHLDINAVRSHLQEIRSTDTKNGIMVISEGLFSMDSDWPDLMRLQDICHEYEATLFVDVAHDLGSMGPGGTGQIGAQGMLGKIDLVMGAFSKTFGTNGGFLATNSRAVKHYVKTFGGPHIFSTAISPVQTAAALEAIRIVRSAEGEALRANLKLNILLLRCEIAKRGICCMGDPSPIVPVPIGSEKVGRLASAALFNRGVFANLVEFPAVAVGASRFRMQVMATHTVPQIKAGAEAVVEAIEEAKALLADPFNSHAVVSA